MVIVGVGEQRKKARITEADAAEVFRDLAKQKIIANPEQWGLVGSSPSSSSGKMG